jgi:hypothetical protein
VPAGHDITAADDHAADGNIAGGERGIGEVERMWRSYSARVSGARSAPAWRHIKQKVTRRSQKAIRQSRDSHGPSKP